MDGLLQGMWCLDNFLACHIGRYAATYHLGRYESSSWPFFSNFKEKGFSGRNSLVTGPLINLHHLDLNIVDVLLKTVPERSLSLSCYYLLRPPYHIA